MLLAIYASIISFANIYKFAGLNIGNGQITHTALDSLYFSIVTWTTLGYGDMHPTESIKLWAGAEALLGTIFIPLFLAAILFSIDCRGKQEKIIPN
jgi:prepilin signal peptidase PulO-like enzyme (type II secretory pathway)